MLLLAAIVALNPVVPVADAYQRMVGSYSGLMRFHDLTDGKEHSFVVDLDIQSGDKVPSTWRWRYNYNPPQFSESTETPLAVNEGKIWQEDPTTTFELRNWSKFESGRSNWFEIERLVQKGMIGSDNVRFRRRYTFKRDRFISDKWLLFPGKKKWEFSHRMELLRKPSPPKG